MSDADDGHRPHFVDVELAKLVDEERARNGLPPLGRMPIQDWDAPGDGRKDFIPPAPRIPHASADEVADAQRRLQAQPPARGRSASRQQTPLSDGHVRRTGRLETVMRRVLLVSLAVVVAGWVNLVPAWAGIDRAVGQVAGAALSVSLVVWLAVRLFSSRS